MVPPTAPYDPGEFPPFAVTADLVVLTVADDRLQVLLVERRAEPFAGRWALPGGFIDKDGRDATLEDTAYRELAEETGLDRAEVHLEQLRTYWHQGRDPRMEVVTVAWLALGPVSALPRAGSDASDARWWDVDEALSAPLAFDHAQILRDALDRARAKLEYTDVAASFLPERFTISDVRGVYRAVWGDDAVPDAGNFQRKMAPVFEPAAQEPRRAGGRGRPAALYRRRGARGPDGSTAPSPVEPPFRRPAP